MQVELENKEIFNNFLKEENKKLQSDINQLRVLCIIQLLDKYNKDKNKKCMILPKHAIIIINFIMNKLFSSNIIEFTVKKTELPILAWSNNTSININCELINESKGIKKLGLIDIDKPHQYQYNYKKIFCDTVSELKSEENKFPKNEVIDIYLQSHDCESESEDKLRDLLMFMLLIEHELIHVLIGRYIKTNQISHGEIFIKLSEHIFGHTYVDLALSHFKLYYDNGYDKVKFRKYFINYTDQFDDNYVDKVLVILEEIRIKKRNEYKSYIYNPFRTFTEFFSLQFKKSKTKTKSKTKSKTKTKSKKSKTKSKTKTKSKSKSTKYCLK